MTNLRKCLGVTTFAVLALAFCCLIIGQAAIAEVDKAVRADNADKSFESAVPLPTVGSRGTTGSALLSDPYALKQLDDDVVLEPLPVQKISISGRTGTGYATKQGGDVIPGVDISGALPINITGTTAGYNNDYEEACPYDAAAPDVVYAFTAAGVGGAPYQYVDFSLVNPGTTYDTKMFIYDSELGLVACNDDDPSDPGYRSSLFGVVLSDGETYYIIIDGYGNESGAYELTIVGGPDPYDCAEGDTDEGETCGTHVNDDGSVDPAVGFGSISDGETICGTLYAEGGVRDNDYFQYTATAELGEELTFTAISDFATSWYIMLYGEDPADGYYTYSIAGGPFEEVQIPYFLAEPGTYTIRITPNLAAANRYGYDCGTNAADPTNGNYRYKLSLDVTIPVPWDDCNLATEIFDGMNSFDLTGATPGGGLGWGPNAWYSYEASANGIATFRVCADQAIAADEDLFVFLAWTQCWNPDGYSNFAYNGGWIPWDCAVDGSMSFAMPMMLGDVMYLEVTSYFAAYDYTGTIEVDLQELEAFNDNCVVRHEEMDLGVGDMLEPRFIHNFAAGTDGVIRFEEFQGFASRCAVEDLGCDVWYTWTADMDGWATVSTCDDDGWDGIMEVYEGFECTGNDPEDDGYRLPIACGDDDCDAEGNGVMPSVEFEIVNGGEYLFRLGGWYRDTDGVATASQGVSWMTIEQTLEAPITRPPNDNCTDITPVLLVPGVETLVYGDCVDGSNHDCLMLAPTVWEAFEIDVCADVRVSYCPTEGVEEALDVTHAEDYEHESGYYYLADQLLLTDCPCVGAIWVAPSDMNGNECDDQHRTEYYDALVPATYYFPILPGWQAGPDYGIPGSGYYGLGFTATEIECVPCEATANLNACPPLTGASWILNVDLEEIDKDPVSPPEDDCLGYEDHTDMIATLYKGISYEIEVVMGKNGTAGEYDLCDVWVDWNQNSGFLEQGERTTLSRLALDWDGIITPPLDAMEPGEGATGYTRMRVRMASTADGENGPCGVQVWGEVEDFTIEVTNIECADFFGDGVGVDDIEFLHAWYFGGTTPPIPWQRADTDGDGVITIADIIVLVDAVHHEGGLICM